MDKIIDFLNGKKTYIIAALVFIMTAITGLYQFGVIKFQVPEFVWTALAALGFATLKASIPSANLQLTGLAEKLFASKYGKYAVAAILAIVAMLQAIGIIIPEFVWMGLTAMGFGSIRANVEVAKKLDPKV